MTNLKVVKADLKRLSASAAFCGAPVGAAGSLNLLGAPSSGEALSLTLALAAFAGAGVWMFRRLRGSSPTEELPETAPEVAPEAREEREPINV